jgi:hypothetical protein
VYVYRNILARSHNRSSSGDATVHYTRVVEPHATVTCVTILSLAQLCFHAKLMSPAAVMYVVFMCSSKQRYVQSHIAFFTCPVRLNRL